MDKQRTHEGSMTPLAQAASGLHEMFRTLIDSGFTEWQACRVIGVMLAENSRQQ